MVQTCGHGEVVAAAKGVDSKHRSVGLELLTKLGANVHATAAARTTSDKSASMAPALLSVGAPGCIIAGGSPKLMATLYSVLLEVRHAEVILG